MNIFLIFWSDPRPYFFFREFIKKIYYKKYNVYLLNRKNNYVHDQNYFNQFCHQHEFLGSSYNILDKILFIYFILCCLLKILYKKPRIVIIYNKYPLIIVFFLKIFFKGKIIYHNFDYNPSKASFLKLSNLTDKIEFFASRFIDYFIFSHSKRAQIFKKNVCLDLKTYVMFNTLSRKSIEHPNKKNRINRKKKIIFRIGSIGPGHSIKNLIRSMTHLNNKIILVIFGVVVDEIFFNEISILIKKLNMQSRIIIKTSVRDYQWHEQLLKSDIGVALYEQVNISHKNMLGASQKINAYLWAGLPIIVSNNNEFNNFSNKFKASKSVDINNPLSIARGIKAVLNSKLIYAKNSKIAFANQYNFDINFKNIEHLF